MAQACCCLTVLRHGLQVHHCRAARRCSPAGALYGTYEAFRYKVRAGPGGTQECWHDGGPCSALAA